MPGERNAIPPDDWMAELPAELRAALDGSACLGAWSHDLSADRFELPAPLGRALDLAPSETPGVPLARLLGGIHPEDRARLESVLLAAWETGEPFEADFRSGATPHEPRRLRLMGSTRAGSPCRASRARGLAFDLTEGRMNRGDPALLVQHRINRVAGHVIAIKGLLEGLDNPALARLVDSLAVETGFELARRLREAAGGRRQ